MPSKRSKYRKRRNTKVLTFATWNVRTLFYNSKADRLETYCFSAQGPSTYNSDIVALKKTRFVKIGQLTDTIS